mmetsp:Transcript_42258/g.69649  ORF Transcript_42258/g.69649 Transcript_42258/m.69649 type:complete len:561 (+) Transcript_42258:101-1783(+)
MTWKAIWFAALLCGEYARAVDSELVPFTCESRQGSGASGTLAKSSVSCEDGETLVSCGVNGVQDINGAWIDPSTPNQCDAYSTSTTYTTHATARCCTFPDGAVDSVSTVVTSSPAQSSTVYCPDGSVLTGCQVVYASGSTNSLKGSWSGPQDPSSQLDWTSTNNQCTGQSKSSATLVNVGAQCITFASDSTLECTTKAAYTNMANFGGCASGYTMTSCNTLTTSHSLDGWYVTVSDTCYVQQDNHAAQYANAICCQLEQVLCVDEDCNDTNVCNGVETCVNGECVSPNDFGECGLNFVCDPIEGCVRDCDTLAIDGYLRDCSEEFDTIKTEGAELVATVDAAVADIADLQTGLSSLASEVGTISSDVTQLTSGLASTNEEVGTLQTDLEAVADSVASLGSELGSTQSDVSTLQSDLSSLSTNVDSITSNVASITSELTDLVARLEALEAFVDAFGPNNARGENSDNSFTSPAERAARGTSAAAHSFAFDDFSSNGNGNGFNLNWAQVAGVVLLVLVTANLVLCAYNFCGAKGKGAKKGYRGVNQYASEDERISVQLKNGH